MNYIKTENLSDYLKELPYKFSTTGLINLFERLKRNNIQKVKITYSANMFCFQSFTPNFIYRIGYDRINWLDKEDIFQEFIFNQKEKIAKFYA